MTAHIPVEAIISHCDFIRVIDVRIGETTITVWIESTRLQVSCPVCGVLTSSVHHTYYRTVQDLPAGIYAVYLVVSVRCFRCTNASCPRKFFSEQIPNLTARYQRRTPRADQRVAELAIEYAAEGCERLGPLLGFSWSADTFLRTVRRLPELPVTKVKILGIDDWALRKGQRYGTLCYDHERHEPVDLLEDRDAESVMKWLKEKQHALEKVTRDSSMTYKDALERGAPGALQIADRFHIQHQFSEAVRKCVRRFVQSIPFWHGHGTVENAPLKEMTSPNPNETLSMKERRMRWEKIHELREQGLSIRAIARQLNLGLATVREYLRRPSPPMGTWSRHKLDPYVAYVTERWQAGCHNAKRLFEEIRAMGYTGGYTQLAVYVSKWRTHPMNPLVPVTSVEDWVRWWFEQKEHLHPENRELFQRWLEQRPEVKEAYELTQRFLTLAREKQVDALSEWLADAENSNVPELRSFARGLRRDEAAVKAALIESWSNGPTEAAVNSLKALKRQMFGRGKFDLLRRRYLLLAKRRRTARRRSQKRMSQKVMEQVNKIA